MKRFLFMLAGGALLSCNVVDSKPKADINHSSGVTVTDPAKFTTIQWLDSTTQNLGSFTEGQVAEISWKFKNTGTKPLVIEDVRPGCGCTVADKPTQPIAPGEEGVIKAKYNSEGHPGQANKTISVLANVSNNNNGSETQLRFTADVKPKS